MNVNAIRHPVVEHDVRASSREPLGDRAAHRATGAGDDRYLAGQVPIWAAATLPAVLAMNI